jgi:hypothetical protein
MQAVFFVRYDGHLGLRFAAAQAMGTHGPLARLRDHRCGPIVSHRPDRIGPTGPVVALTP